MTKTARHLSPYGARIRLARIRHLKTLAASSLLADPDHDEDIQMLLGVAGETGLGQKEIAACLDAGQSTVSRWIAGRQLPRSRYQRRLLLEALVALIARRVEEATRTPARPKNLRATRPTPRKDPA